ncbi:MAG: helix-turn-helix domain-containing protein [Streptococcaceae bacterium]|jgi:transcriptional regulator with XRE-family HTH domain|nr:helix-turn-helix domain-containing protein [Streptococcaceae bacterium]
MTLFYDRLRQLAKNQGLTFRKIERDIGYPLNSLANYRQEKEPSARRVLEISRYFNVSPTFLLGETNSEIVSRCEVLLEKLTENRQVEILKIVEKTFEDQKNELSGNFEANPKNNSAHLSVIQLVSVGESDAVWRIEPSKKIKIPFNEIPVNYDSAIQVLGADFPPLIKAGDIIFVKFNIRKYRTDLPNFIIANYKFTELPQSDGSVLYIKNYTNSIDEANVGEITGLYREK